MNCDEDPSILKAKKTMDKVLKPLNDHNAKIRADLESKITARRAEKWVSAPSETSGRHNDVSPRQEDVSRTVDEISRKAGRESFEKSELDPVAATDPENDEKVA